MFIVIIEQKGMQLDLGKPILLTHLRTIRKWALLHGKAQKLAYNNENFMMCCGHVVPQNRYEHISYHL